MVGSVSPPCSLICFLFLLSFYFNYPEQNHRRNEMIFLEKRSKDFFEVLFILGSRSIDCSSGWLFEWLIDWLIGLLIGWLVIFVGIVFCSAEGFKVGCDWTRAVFSPDGQYAMAGSNDGTLYVWNLKPGQHDNVEKTLKEHQTTIQACAWHPQGNQLLSCDKNKKVVLWSDSWLILGVGVFWCVGLSLWFFFAFHTTVIFLEFSSQFFCLLKNARILFSCFAVGSFFVRWSLTFFLVVLTVPCSGMGHWKVKGKKTGNSNERHTAIFIGWLIDSKSKLFVVYCTAREKSTGSVAENQMMTSLPTCGLTVRLFPTNQSIDRSVSTQLDHPVKNQFCMFFPSFVIWRILTSQLKEVSISLFIASSEYRSSVGRFLSI